MAKCIGTVVNQNRPLCNMGLVAKSYAESTLSMMLGAWLIFTESYAKILDASLLSTQQKQINIEWVDDASTLHPSKYVHVKLVDPVADAWILGAVVGSCIRRSTPSSLMMFLFICCACRRTGW